MQVKKNSRRLKAEETKRRIYDAATSLLNERPYEEITVRDIVQRAEVAIGTFYIYFPSKKSVYFEVYSYTDKYFSDVVRTELNQKAPHDRILAFFEAVAHNIIDFFGMELTKLMFNPNNHLIAPRLAEYETVKLLKEAIKSGVDSGYIRPDLDIDNVVLCLMICSRGAILHWCMCDGKHDLVASMRNCIAIMLDGLRNTPNKEALKQLS